MTRPAAIDERLRHFPTILSRWRGGHARIWELTTSHATLTIRVEIPGRHGNLRVACLGPLFIQGPYEWSNCDLRVDWDGTSFVVYDDAAGLEVVTESVEIAENRKPLNVFGLK